MRGPSSFLKKLLAFSSIPGYAYLVVSILASISSTASVLIAGGAIASLVVVFALTKLIRMNIIRRKNSEVLSYPVIMECIAKPVMNSNAPENGGLIVYFIDKTRGIVLNNDLRHGVKAPVGTLFDSFAAADNSNSWAKSSDEFVLSN